MKRISWVAGGRAPVLAAVAAAGLCLAGCGDPKEGSTAAVPDAEAKGEPIRGEAISSPAKSADTAAAAAAVPPGVEGGKPAPAVAAGDAAASVPTPGAGVAGVDVKGTPGTPLTVGFEKLASFQYTLPDGPIDTNTVVTLATSAQIPVTIQALNNQFISLKGFMLPLKVEKGLVTELLIMRDQSMCCYGTVPRINEWVSVKMVGGGVKPVMDQAVTLFGRLKVGEMYENGYLVGIYAMDGERMAGPLDM